MIETKPRVNVNTKTEIRITTKCLPKSKRSFPIVLGQMEALGLKGARIGELLYGYFLVDKTLGKVHKKYKQIEWFDNY